MAAQHSALQSRATAGRPPSPSVAAAARRVATATASAATAPNGCVFADRLQRIVRKTAADSVGVAGSPAIFNAARLLLKAEDQNIDLDDRIANGCGAPGAAGRLSERAA